MPSTISKPGYKAYVLFVLWVAYVLNFIDRQLITILLEPIKQEFGVSDTAMGFLSGFAFALFYASLGIPVARLADRWSRKNVIAISVGLWSLMTALSGLTASFFQLALARIGVGIGEAGGTPPSHSLIADYFDATQRATALGIYSTATLVGILIGMLGGAYIADAYGWRMAFIVFGAPGILVSLVVALTVQEPQRAAPIKASSLKEDFTHIWQLPSFRGLALAGSITALGNYGIGTWSPSFLIRTHGMGLIETGILLGGVGAISGIIGTVAGGVLCDRLTQRNVRWQMWLPAFGAFASTPAMAAFLLWPASEQVTILGMAVPVAMAFNAASGVLAGLWIGPTYAAIQNLAPATMRAQASAIFLFFFNLVGLGLGPLVIGIASDSLSPHVGDDALRYAMLLSVAIVCVGAYLFWHTANRYAAAMHEGTSLTKH